MERCLTDLACSMKVMRSFANGKNLGDCDGDGRMTCDDYSMAHQLGHIGCTDPDKRTNYKKSKVYECYTECKNFFRVEQRILPVFPKVEQRIQKS